MDSAVRDASRGVYGAPGGSKKKLTKKERIEALKRIERKYDKQNIGPNSVIETALLESNGGLTPQQAVDNVVQLRDDAVNLQIELEVANEEMNRLNAIWNHNGPPPTPEELSRIAMDGGIENRIQNQLTHISVNIGGRLDQNRANLGRAEATADAMDAWRYVH